MLFVNFFEFGGFEVFFDMVVNYFVDELFGVVLVFFESCNFGYVEDVEIFLGKGVVEFI